jgi:hypothetical protein
MKSRWIRNTIAVGIVSVFVPTVTTACFGSFALTRKVYNFNRSVSSDKWVRSLMFLVLLVLYPVAELIDALFGNAIEFWGGANPINLSAGTTRTVIGSHGETMTMTLRADGAIDVVVFHPDGELQTLVLTRSNDTIEARDAQGNLIARVGDRNGEPALLAGSIAPH